MTVLNDAGEVFFGDTEAHEIYLGDTFVWASAPVPSAPSSFGAGYASPAENWLVWWPPTATNEATTYEVRYSVTGPIAKSGDGIFLAQLPFTTTASVYSHVKTPGEEEVDHWYSVFCRLANGRAGEHATLMSVKAPPSAPDSLVANGASTTSNSLTWTPPSPIGTADGYRLLSKTGAYATGPDDATATVLLDNVPLTTLSYSHTGLATETTYYYNLYCTSELGYGAVRKDTAATLKPPPPVPDITPLGPCMPGWLYCLWWADWDNPANCTTDTRYRIDAFHVHCQANTQTPPGYGGVNTINYTSVNEGTGNYYRFPPMDGSNPAASYHSISIYASNVSGNGAPGGTWSTTGNQNPCGARSASAERTLEDDEPQRKVMYEKWCGMPFPEDESQAWAVVERQLANTDHTDEEGWWARLLLSIDVLSYRGGVSQEVVDSGAEIGWPESAAHARTFLSPLLEHLTSLVVLRNLDAVYLAGLEAIRAWYSIDGE